MGSGPKQQAGGLTQANSGQAAAIEICVRVRLDRYTTIKASSRRDSQFSLYPALTYHNPLLCCREPCCTAGIGPYEDRVA